MTEERLFEWKDAALGSTHMIVRQYFDTGQLFRLLHRHVMDGTTHEMSISDNLGSPIEFLVATVHDLSLRVAALQRTKDQP